MITRISTKAVYEYYNSKICNMCAVKSEENIQPLQCRDVFYYVPVCY